MNNFLNLFIGEVQRMKKYHILSASVFVSFFWIGMVHLLNVPDITFLFLMVVFFDLVSMSILMVGVTIFFEKQEGVLKSLIVSPISKTEFLTAKTLGNLVSNIVTITIVYIYAIIFQDININLLAFIGAFFLVGLFHTFVGMLLIYKSRDFTELLVKMMTYFLLFMIPVVFEQFGLITSRLYSNVLYIIPTKSAATLLEAVAGNVDLWEILISVFYLSIGSIILGYFVFKKFKDFAIRESGV
ncbi:ABC transporter permease [Natronospora cellulosivora (SeqCode)]